MEKEKARLEEKGVSHIKRSPVRRKKFLAGKKKNNEARFAFIECSPKDCQRKAEFLRGGADQNTVRTGGQKWGGGFHECVFPGKPLGVA